MAVIVVVVLEAGLGPVGFGVSGPPLLLTVASAAYAGAGYAFLRGVSIDPAWVLLAESRRAEQAAIVVAERARLAQDLHDVLAHTLSGLALQLEGANLLATSTPADPRLVDTVERAHQLSKSGLAEARRVVGALRGDELPGPERIGDLVAEHRLASRGSVRFGENGSPVPLSPETGLALYRAAQEALSNVRKHAGNADVDVALAWADDHVELTVADTGDGGSVSLGGSGYGLPGMAERMNAVGGSVEAAAVTGQGFRVHVTVPTTGQLPSGQG